ncbi:MAG: hypothetical protein RL483_540 [Pseudomonadota bacterium]
MMPLKPGLQHSIVWSRLRAVWPAALMACGLWLFAPVAGQASTAQQTDPKVIFQILASELALQQGEIGLAASTYLALAEQTQDPVVAERATQLALVIRAPKQALAAARIWLAGKPQDANAQESVDVLSLLLGYEHDLTDRLLKRRQGLTTPQELEAFYERLSGLVMRASDPKKALAILTRVSEREPQHTRLLYAKAMLHEKLKEHGPAEAALRLLVSRTPEDADALNALGYSLADQNRQLPEALTLLEKAHRLKPEDGHILDSMGWVHYRLGHLDKARDFLQKAFMRMPDAEVAAHLGEVLWTSNQANEALIIWRHGRAANPQNPLLLETMRRFGVSIE